MTSQCFLEFMYNKRSYNLCSTYILPLVGLNRWSFGSPDNFINSYVSKEKPYIVVELKSLTLPENKTALKFDFRRDDNIFVVFEVPSKFQDCLDKFREGKYSTFSEEAKATIRKKSGLRYKAPQPNGTVRSARELLALDKDKELKKAIESELSNPGSPVKLSDDAELASLPDESNFISLNLNKDIPVMTTPVN